MSRWNKDLVFYRVFCVALLATAFIFTLILTNVFIDIEGLLSNKKAVPYASKVSVAVSKDKDNYVSVDDPNIFYNDESNYEGDDNPAYRTKRSTETENILFHVKNPIMKKLITRRLANLLEELDKEDPKQKQELQPEVTTVRERNEKSKLTPERVGRDNLLHLAMHNILLQGLIGHMDLNDIYKKVHKLFRNFKDNSAIYDEGKELEAAVESKEISEGSVNTGRRRSYDEEHNFLNEIIKCKQLKNEVSQNNEHNNNNRTIPIEAKTDKPIKVIIKTIIEINEDNNLKNSSSKDVEGLIRLIYNGKPIKFNRMSDEPSKKRQNNRDVEEVTVSNYINNTEITEKLPVVSKTQIKNPLNMVIEEYLTKHPFLNYLEDGEEIKTFQAKRLKRQIKIRYFNNNKTSTLKSKQPHNKTKKAEDDLYIEIETHFDGKGVKGEKKKKLVKNLIDKIQKALHTDIEQPNDKERIKFIKRVQDPIDFKKHSIFINKIIPAYEAIEERHLDPIGKTLDNHENVINRFGENWKKQVAGPSFLTGSKSVNSAEMRELNINYDAVSRNGIPKRLQEPLNTEFEEDFTTTSTNVGNVSLFLKDIDGTGFSIGINQYVGEPPDRDSMQIFNGLESLIKEYHKTYDQEEVSNESNIDRADNFVEKDHKLKKRGVYYKKDDLKEIISKTDPNFRSNSYNLSYKYNIGFFHKYPSLFKHLNNDVVRKKRSINVKKISNLNSKIKLNRYINTNAMANKKIFLKNKRNKRQVHNIRIIARDRSETSPKHSDENIFLVSRENAYSDRASILSEMNEPETVIDKKNREMYDEALPFGDFYKMQIPEAQSIFSDNEYDSKVRPSLFMSRYPHIFMDDITKTKNENSNYHLKERNIHDKKQYRIKHDPKESKIMNRFGSSTVNSMIVSENEQKGDVFLNSILPPPSKSKYKVTVKVSPKNISTNAGFKEVHTSVNKSYDQNGLRYFSLLNVSQISKIEKLNKSETESELKHETIRNEANSELYNNHLKKQQKQMKALLRLHKKRVDQQLGNLIRESKHLERMMADSSMININKTISILNDDGEGADKLRDEKINKILDSVKKLEETYKPVLTTTLGTIQHTTALQSSTTLIPIETDNIQLIDTIKLNEKVTYEILKKIDSNTNILKTFLQKLQIGDKILDKPTTEKTFGEVKLDMTEDWKSYKVRNPFFVGDESKNNTLPFVYAYQQPIPIKSKTQPLASLMYHGHIHTNAVQDINHDKFKKTNNNIDLDKNNSTFLVKEMDDFKKKKRPFISDNFNTTSA